MRKADPRFWAVGDVVEVRDVLTGKETVLPLAGPANRQGGAAAESIAGRTTQFRAVQATAVVGVLSLTVASTGASGKGLQCAGGRVRRGGEAHRHHRDRIQFRGTMYHLAEAELRYAPQFGAAKDPANLAGMLAENVLGADMPVADWLDLARTEALCWMCVNPVRLPAGTCRTPSTCRSPRRPVVTASRPRIATSGSAASWDSVGTTPHAFRGSTGTGPRVYRGAA